MIPMIEKEIEGNGWLSASEFFDIVAIAEMTPGPIAVNSATFVGYKTAGFFGRAYGYYRCSYTIPGSYTHNIQVLF